MNGKPNVEPAWMSLKRLVETRMIEILRKEQDNKRYIRLYGTEDYWHAFEESAFQLERLFRKGETTLFSHKDYPFPVVMVSSIFRFVTSTITRNCWRQNSPPQSIVHGMNTR